MPVIRLLPALLLAVALTLTPTPVRAATRSAQTKRSERFDLRYCNGSKRCKLDVIAPAGKKNLPVVLVVHGGTWMFGDKNFFGLYRDFGRFLADKGMVAVLTNYRLSPGVKHPEHVKDIARAFAWVRRNVGKYGGDPDRIILCGHS